MAAQNKVKFNLKNVYYAMLQEDPSTGVVTYGAPKRFPGAVSLSLSAEGENEPFYADGVSYYVVSANNGYSGDFEMARIIDDFKKDVLGYELDENAVLVENIDSQVKPFALMFQFDGDQHDVRHVLYNCTCTRPDMESQTIEDKVEVKTDKVTLSANSVIADGKNIIKAETTADTNAAAYAAWFTQVYMPDWV